MPKRASKRQRIENDEEGETGFLGQEVSANSQGAKDDEERRLESILFGKPYKPARLEDSPLLAKISTLTEGAELAVPGRTLENLLDSDLFFVDDSLRGEQGTSTQLDPFAELGHEPSTTSDDDEEHDRGDSEPSSSGSAPEDADEPWPPSQPRPDRKGPAWIDPDDKTLTVSLATNRRLRKLRNAPTEDAVSGREYEVRLRTQFEKINPVPEWATDSRKRAKRRRSIDVNDELPDLMSSTNGILAQKKNLAIPQGELGIERLKDANQGAKSEGPVKAVQFHPSPKVPLLLTAGADRRLRLFNIDGHTNPHVQTLHVPELPITTAVFHPTGSSIILTGPRPFYYAYDLQSGSTHRSPRGLWGTTFNNANPSTQDASMEICAFSPGAGEVLAVGGRRGYVHLVDWRSGSGQVVGSVKMNASVKSVGWSRTGTGVTQLMTLAEDSEVYVWDIGSRRCIHRWKDDGGFGSSILSSSPTNTHLAIGSTSGYVNIYGEDTLGGVPSSTPKPLKAFGNLTTAISSLTFNADAQLLAVASKIKKDQLRLLHLRYMTAFSNWPTSNTPLGHVTSVGFSSDSSYIAIGNTRGRVLLYNLKHFSSFR